VPLATSVRALAALKRDGRVGAIGLCNVTVGQIEEARRITEIDPIQVELSLWHDEHFLSGVASYCLEHRLPLAYRPLGGRSPSPALPPMGAERDCGAARGDAVGARMARRLLTARGPNLGAARRDGAITARAVALELSAR
jgi:aryl-alcohol dehydrogenase-like predicted oxidoreductase